MSKSLFECISENVNEEGLLPDDFHLPDNSDGELKFADGAWDGICIYHMGRHEITKEQLEKIGAAVWLAANGKTAEADNAFKSFANEYKVINIIDEIQQYIIDHSKELDANNLYRHAWHMILESDDRESVKAGLVILELIDNGEKMKEVIRTIGLSDEFTIFSVFLMRNWENGNLEVYELAKRVHGWGRVHAVEFLEPANDDIRNWLLTDAVDNKIMPSYLGLTCFNKAEVVNRLNRGNLTKEEVHGVLKIVDAMLDEGPVPGISTLEDPEDLLVKVLKCARDAMPLDIWDYETVNNISNWQEETREEDNSDIESLVDEIMRDERCRSCVADEVKKGKHINLAIEIGINYKEDLYVAMLEDFSQTYQSCGYLMQDENYRDKVIELFRNNLSLELLKTGAADSMGLGKEFEKSTMMAFILQELRNLPGYAEDIVETAIQMPAIRNRNGAIKVMQCWVEDAKFPLEQISPRLYKVLTEIRDREVKEHLVKQIDELIEGKIVFEDEEIEFCS